MKFYWLSPSTEIRRSNIHGHGRFAKHQIEANTLIMVIGGRIIDRTVDQWTTGIPVNENLIIQGSDDFLENGAMNHSCAPNVEIRGDISFYTTRSVQKDCELTVDYGTFLFTSSPKVFINPCACQETHCRKMVTGDDWTKLQTKGISLSYYLQTRIKHEPNSLL